MVLPASTKLTGAPVKPELSHPSPLASKEESAPEMSRRVLSKDRLLTKCHKYSHISTNSHKQISPNSNSCPDLDFFMQDKK